MNNGDTVRVNLPGTVLHGKTGVMQWTRTGAVVVTIDGFPNVFNPWDVEPAEEPI